MTPLDYAVSAAMSGDVDPGHFGVHYPMYLDQVIQCLIVGDYSRGGPYAMEALHHYLILEHVRRRDPDVRNWSLCGLILRLALRKGYHREPSRFPNITPFEGEMRRRQWMLLYCMDVVISIQMGMPRLIKDEQCDTKLPHNLLDTDFDEDTKELPPPRSDAEITPILSFVARYKMMIVLAKVADLTCLTTAENEDPCSSPSIRHVETLLRNTYIQLPDGLKFTSFSGCLGASPESIADKLSTSILLRKGLIILHRRHVVGERFSANPSSSGVKHTCSATCVDKSVRTCIDAALQILEYQEFVHSESQDGGGLSPFKWRLSSSLLSHEFLMATSVLCSYLYRVYRSDSDVADAPKEQIHAIEKALGRTYGIWQSQTHRSKDVKRATDTLGMLIGKLQGHGGSDTQLNEVVDIPNNETMPGPHPGIAGAMLHDGIGLYGESLDDFEGIITWAFQ